MATVTAFTSARMLAIEDRTVVSGTVDTNGNLILTTHKGDKLNAGRVKGDQGIQGLHGINGGLAAKRNSIFGVPSSDAEKLALANQAPLWFNATTGALETYRLPTGTTGLTMPGTPAGTAAGWYPLPAYSNMPLGLVARKSNLEVSIQLGGNWVPADILNVTLVKDRWYKVEYGLDTVCNAPNIAVECEIRKSITTDTSSVGTIMDDSRAFYTAPVALQGNSSNNTYRFKAAATETVNIKACLKRASGVSTYDISKRKFSIYDEGAQI